MAVEPNVAVTAAAAATSVALGIALSPAEISQYILTIFGGLVGAMHSVARVETNSRLDAAWYILKWVLSAVVLTSLAAHLIEHLTGFPAQRWPGVVAFLITFLADRWPTWLNQILAARARAASGDPDK